MSGALIFEGEYLNGKRSGKGKEYIGGFLVFEGEYLNDQRNGKGREYNISGKIIFEGEYLYNKRLKGKLYKKGKLAYEGEYLYDKSWSGKGFDENGNIIFELIKGKGMEYSAFDNLI